MLVNRNINVCLVSDLFENYPLSENTIVVVVDLLRATTVISTAFNFGVKEIIPVSSLEIARRYLDKQNYIVAAERNAMPIEGFDYGNSPFQYMNNEILDKTLVLTTTNGTKAINIASEYEVITSCFINIEAVEELLLNSKKDVLILCSGWKGVFNLEDTIFSGCLANKLICSKKFNVNCDSTLAALNLYNLAKHDYFSFLSNSAHRKRLKSLNIEKDTEFCLNPDFKSNIIPTLINGKLVAKKI
jgi:2-phosphosulfolactate phosphatase